MGAQGLAIQSACRASGVDGIVALLDYSGRVLVARSEDYRDGHVCGRVAVLAEPDGERSVEVYHALYMEHNPWFRMTARKYAEVRDTLKRATLAVRLMPMARSG